MTVSKKGTVKRRRKRPPAPRPLSLSGLVQVLVQDSSRVHPTIARVLPGALRAGNLRQVREICEEFGSPQKYGDPDSYLASVQVLALVKKFPFPTSAKEREETAFAKFSEAELSCAEVNQRFRSRSLPFEVYNYLNQAAIHLDTILGDFSRQYPSVLEGAKHGPGSSLCTTGNRVSPFYKVSTWPWSSGRRSAEYFKDVLDQDPLLAEIASTQEGEVLTECDFNKLTFVPKDAWTMRTIAIEPRLNCYLQLGVNRVLTRNLKNAGCDIRDQEVNQKLAYHASLPGGPDLATVDLKSASDSIAFELVRYMLRGSPDWYDFLYDLRSPMYSYKGVKKSYEKWSSMGNGYTFPLESALFYTLARAIVDDICPNGQVSVYGDDIIVPTEAYPVLKRVLGEIGFATNETKTFTQGPFRESCGKDFWYGINVRPFYLDFEPQAVGDYYHLLNSLASTSVDLNTSAAYRWLLGHLDDRSKRFGPVTKDTRSHIWAPFWFLYREGHLRYSRKYHRLEYRTTRVRAKDYRELHRSPEGTEDLAMLYMALSSGSSGLLHKSLADLWESRSVEVNRRDRKSVV